MDWTLRVGRHKSTMTQRILDRASNLVNRGVISRATNIRGRVGLGNRNQEFSVEHVICSLNTQMEMWKKQVGIQIWRSGERLFP